MKPKAIIRLGFTLVELIFVIVIIGILAAVAVPKFSHMSDNAKISAEIATASAVQTAIDACHGEWVLNEADFVCGRDIKSSELNSYGYPEADALGTSDSKPLNRILKNGDSLKWIREKTDGRYRFKGPASNHGIAPRNPDITGKPDGNDYWDYNSTNGEFKLKDIE